MFFSGECSVRNSRITARFKVCVSFKFFYKMSNKLNFNLINKALCCNVAGRKNFFFLLI